jgi:signal transduction histidine kinase
MNPASRERRGDNGHGEPTADHDLARDQREVNEQLLLAALRAFDEAEAAGAIAKDHEVREEALRATAEIRERFLGILSHDLRNPLGAMIMGANVLIANGNLSEGDGKVAAQIIRSGNRMARMIAHLLDLTRVRLGGGLELTRQKADLGDVCRSIGAELELGASVPVRCRVRGDVRGEWDVDRVGELVSNIAGNAIEHATPGTEITLETYADGDDVVVEITNEGPPIPPDVLPWLFEPFRRGEAPKSSTAGNLGLGLYIAREVVRAHDGTLDARSSDGRTTFVIRLPRHASSPSPLPSV